MRITRKFILVISQSFMFLLLLSALDVNCSNNKFISSNGYSDLSTKFYAVNDTFYFVTNCTSVKYYDNVLNNDVFIDSENVQICYIFAPKDGVLTFGSNGRFMLVLPEDYSGTLEFNYSICNKKDGVASSEAKVVVIVENDNDCDGIVNEMDMDNDNDGILDADEGNGLVDSDGDGLPDNFDIDSDNDGISDNEEWQKEGKYIRPFEADKNANGWDDAYDIDVAGVYYKAVDTDENGTPDLLDTDSDADGISDNIEGFDANKDGVAEISPLFMDSDNDGLDDAFDVITCWSLGCNSIGSNSPLPDGNNNGIRDWRESDTKGEHSSSSAFEVFVYPNPSSGSFMLTMPFFNDNQNIEVQITNIHGNVIYKELLSSANSKIDLGDVSSGNYIIHIKTASENYQSIISIQ